MTSIETINTTDFKAKDILFSPQDKPYGKPFVDWTVEWWKWILSIPKQFNPNLRPNELLNRAYIGDNVVFFAGTFDYQNQLIHEMEIPRGVAMLFPLINSTNSYAEDPDNMKTEADLGEWAREDINGIAKSFMTINTKNVFSHDWDHQNYSCISEPFEMYYEKDNVWDCKPGKTTAISIGFWAFVKPLPPGKFIINVGGQCLTGKIKINVLYNLTIH